MTEKRLCVIDSCDYCPYLEDIKIEKNLDTRHSKVNTFYRCNKTLLCVESGKVYLKNPLQLLFKYCPLPDSNSGDVK